MLKQTKSPKTEILTDAREEVNGELQNLLEDANRVLLPLELETNLDQIMQDLHEAEKILNEYKLYAERLTDQAERHSKKNQQIEVLQSKLSEILAPFSARFPESEVPEKLKLIRDEINKSNQISAKIRDSESELEQQRNNLAIAKESIKKIKAYALSNKDRDWNLIM